MLPISIAVMHSLLWSEKNCRYVFNNEAANRSTSKVSGKEDSLTLGKL